IRPTSGLELHGAGTAGDEPSNRATTHWRLGQIARITASDDAPAGDRERIELRLGSRRGFTNQLGGYALEPVQPETFRHSASGGQAGGLCACSSRRRSMLSSVILLAWPVPTLSYSPRFRRAEKVVLPMPSISQTSFGLYALRNMTDRSLRGVIRRISYYAMATCHD